MSLASKGVLLLAGVVTCGTIAYVHYKQWYDKQKLHEGVIRDVERQRRRKIENLYLLQQQTQMTKILSKEQSLDDVTSKLLEDSKNKT